MILFNSDYLEGAHPVIMARLFETNLEQTPGYGEDEHCERARAMIRELCDAPDADVHFLVGGTQTNFTFLSAVLKPWQGVICADTGHIAVHETGAVEATGHKVIALPGHEGRLTAADVDAYCDQHFADESHEHMVMPGAVYISNPTEVGTLYSREALCDLREVCDRWGLVLFLDGARLGYGLASPENDLDLPFIAAVTDAFYIGGTKQGLLFGEALIITREDLQPHFRYMIKQKGGLLAKGRLLGVQFEAAFEGDLYMDMARHAIALALHLKEALQDMGVPFMIDSPTNQQFPILPDALLEDLRHEFSYATIQKIDPDHTVIRFCTSWATRPEHVERLIDALRELLG